MDDKIKEVMGLVCSYGLLCADYDNDECDLALSRMWIESKLRELVQESERMRSSIENLKRAHESDEADGGEMWYAEAILPAVEACIKELP